MFKRKILVVGIISALVAVSPAYAMSGSGMGQSVPVIEDNSGAALESTQKIEEYLKQLNEFFGTTNNTSEWQNSSGLDLNQSLSSITGGGFANYKTEALNATLGSDLSGGAISSEAISMYFPTDESNLCNKLSNQSQVKNQASSTVKNFATSIMSSLFGGKDIEKTVAEKFDADDQGAEMRMALACNSARNMIAMTLYDIRNAMNVLEKRNAVLQDYLKEKSTDSGQLQKRQYQIGVMQALIQNDMARLQAALSAYQTKIAFYKQVQAEAAHEIIYGGQKGSKTMGVSKLDNLTGGGTGTTGGGKGILSGAAGGGISTLAGVGVGVGVAKGLDSNSGSGVLNKILNAVSSAYDELKEKLDIS